jgi:hypothetical protein
MLNNQYLVQYRQEEFRREAAHYRLINLAKKHQSRRNHFSSLVFTWLGGRLCRWGILLQERFSESETVTPCDAMKSSLEA